MTLYDLKRSVDSYVDLGHGENDILITLSQKSVGARMSVGVRGIYAGFDFESGQIRIEPMEPICKRGRAKDDPVAMNIFAFSSPRKFYSCPMCEETVKKDAHYCPRCGQHLFFDPTKEPLDSYKSDTKQRKVE